MPKKDYVRRGSHSWLKNRQAAKFRMAIKYGKIAYTNLLNNPLHFQILLSGHATWLNLSKKERWTRIW
jgi:hypothetical protein